MSAIYQLLFELGGFYFTCFPSLFQLGMLLLKLRQLRQLRLNVLSLLGLFEGEL